MFIHAPTLSQASPSIPQEGENLLLSAKASIEEMMALPIEKRNYENTFGVLNGLRVRATEMLMMMWTAADQQGGADTSELMQTSSKFTSDLMSNNALYRFLVETAQVHSSTFTPSQKFLAKRTFDPRAQEGLPYEYRSSSASEKPLEEGKFTLFTLNVCGLPGDLARHYGGVLPWKDRLNPLVATIKASDADVVCLQEVFDPTLAEALHDKLSSQYPHIYLHVAEKSFGFSPDAFGLGSGLMVMSRVPINDARYVPFTAESPHVNRGLFIIEVGDGKGNGVARIATAHLVAFDSTESRSTREVQTKEILKTLNSFSKEIPLFFCGDLNIDRGTEDPSEKKFDQHFEGFNAFTEPTYIDYTAYWQKKEDFSPRYQTLDYVLKLRSAAPATCDVRVINTWGEHPPIDSVSDHRALLAKIECKTTSN